MDDRTEIVDPIVREHLEQAAFQWAQRDDLARQDPPDAAALAHVDQRLEANLDGIRIAGTLAWPLIVRAVETYGEKGEIFVAMVRAVEEARPDWIEMVLDAARLSEDGVRGVCGAMEWLPEAKTGALVHSWLRAADPLRCEAALAALMAHGGDVAGVLPQVLMHSGPGVRASACRLAGAHGGHDVVPILRQLALEQNPVVAVEAARTLARKGMRDGETVLRVDVLAQAPGWIDSLRALIFVVPMTEMRAWLSVLNSEPDTQVTAVRAAGLLGDRSLAGWLIRQMAKPRLAEAAGMAFCSLFPTARTEDALWSQDPDILGPEFAAHFDNDLPMLPVAARFQARGFA